MERDARIGTVIGYMLEHLNGDLSLARLAEVAHWSPLHLQRAFKKATGESPKRYATRTRLMLVARDLKVHPHRTITEVGSEYGFASLAELSRAAKRCFRLTPTAIRGLSWAAFHDLLHRNGHFNPPGIKRVFTDADAQRLSITMVDVGAMKGWVLTADMIEEDSIGDLFRRAMQKVTGTGHAVEAGAVIGITCPHPGSPYRVFIPMDKSARIPKGMHARTIPAGRYVAFRVHGDRLATLLATHHVVHSWLPSQGLRLGNVLGFERFDSDPGLVRYDRSQRIMHLPIERI